MQGVATAFPLESLLAPGRALRPAGAGVVSALSSADEGAPYDRRAAAYDRLIGNRVYNRLVWGASVADYEGLPQRRSPRTTDRS